LDELIMAPALDDLSVVEYEDHVCGADRREREP
jgi:hypothetical protein